MNEYNVVGLYDHNAESYNKIKESFKTNKEVAIVHATGTGKSFNAIQYAYDNKDKKIVYVVPYNTIIEHLNKIIEDNPNLTEDDFKHVEFRTYTSFINMSSEELENLEVDTLILDEFHHIGAPIWGARIQSIINTHPDLNILGMTAYTVRDRGTSYERDMVNPEGGELFSNKVVSNYDLCDAMIDGVLPKPIYKSAYVNLEGTYEHLENKINSLDHESKDYQELSKLMNDIKKRIHEAPSMADVFKNNIKKDGKYIYFCPLNSEDGVNDIDTIQKEVKEWLKQMGLSEDEYILYTTTSQMGEDGKKNRDAFYNDKDLNEESADNKLRIMFAINQYNEGTHVPNIDGVIMGRTTQSDIVFFEQLGRALAVRGKTKEVFDFYESKSIDELKKLCSKRNIEINDNLSKSDIIELLTAPTIIDLANNIEFIKDLENNLKDRLKLVQGDGLGNKRISHISNANFDIDMLNQNIFEIIKYMRDRLTMTWEDKYKLAKAYYEHYGDLRIKQGFKTINGVDPDENGIDLGKWIGIQRIAYREKSATRITQEQIDLLDEIGMKWNVFDYIFERNYGLAKAYYEHYDNLLIPNNFKTTNGYEYDEKGINLGEWLGRMRRGYNNRDNNNYRVTDEMIQLLNQIGMVWKPIKDKQWIDKYELVKMYYEHYGNIDIPYRFKTINGIDPDENGVDLDSWIKIQRRKYKDNSLTDKQIKLLEQLGIIWENERDIRWTQMYELAKTYYEHYGNIDISSSFKTLDGINYDEKGLNLGMWIHNQRANYNKSLKNRITPERLKMLDEIGMKWDVYKEKWAEMYKLAKAYYEHYGNLLIPNNFKTTNGIDPDENGIDLGTWLSNQRSSYNNKVERKITQDKIDLLNEIGMIWNKYDESWTQMYELAKAYYEHYGDSNVPPTFKTTNGIDPDENGFSLGVWIRNQRRSYNDSKGNKLSREQVEKLNQIKMRLEHVDLMENWLKKYNLAKAYYEHYGNLKISNRFKTINGIDPDENGVALGYWISDQRKAFKEEKEKKITKEQIDLLNQIGMVWEPIKNEKWYHMYELAKAYYEHYGNIDVEGQFKTTNGYEEDENGIDLGKWIKIQRDLYKGNTTSKLDSKQIQLLEKLDMKWFNDKIDEKIQKEEITEKNKLKKQKELISRFNTLAIKYDDKSLPSKDEINQDFMDQLNRKR